MEGKREVETYERERGKREKGKIKLRGGGSQ